jgi:hypothetical protein
MTDVSDMEQVVYADEALNVGVKGRKGLFGFNQAWLTSLFGRVSDLWILLSSWPVVRLVLGSPVISVYL